MRIFKAKLTALFVAIGCFAVCCGFGVFATMKASQTNVTANAETVYTTYTIHTLCVADVESGGNIFYASVLNGDKPSVNSWDHRFTLESGTGATLNGDSFTLGEIKQPGDRFYIVVGKGNKCAIVFIN